MLALLALAELAVDMMKGTARRLGKIAALAGRRRSATVTVLLALVRRGKGAQSSTTVRLPDK